MCGLIALRTAEKAGFVSYEKEELKQMMVINSFRGIHSTGLAGVDSGRKGEVNIVKATGSPYSLYSYPDVDKFFSRMIMNFDTVIGHGRFATRGAVDAINAHPFQEGHITLAHNGTISNFYSLKDHQKHKGIEVDSHLIAKLFEEEGAENVLPRIEGAYVFMWYDDSNQTFNVVRNKERPLFLAKTHARETLMMASEATTIAWNATRNNTEMDTIIELPEHVIYTYKVGSIVAETASYTPIPPKVYSYERNYNRTEHNGWKAPSTKSQAQASVITTLDELVRDTIVEDVTIELGMEMDFIMDDYQDMRSYYTVTGYNEAFPDILFRGAFPMPMDERTLLDADIVRGTVSNIYPYHKATQNKNLNFTVFIGDPKLLSNEEAEGEQTVQITDFMTGAIETITKFRLEELAINGCVWCSQFIPTRTLRHPNALLISHVEEQDKEGIVCAKCTENYHRATYNTLN